MPSLPTNAPRRSYPSVSPPSLPSTTTSPSGSTTSSGEDVRRRDAVGQAVRPAGVVGDVAADRAALLAARVGREVQAVAAPRARVRSRLSTPGSTHASRLHRRRPTAPGSSSSSTITTAPSSGVAPPARPVPAPRATNGMPCGDGDAATTACTSSVVVGKQTTPAAPSMFDASRRYRPSSVEPVRTRSAPSAAQRVDAASASDRTVAASPSVVAVTSGRGGGDALSGRRAPGGGRSPGRLDRPAVDEHRRSSRRRARRRGA